MNQASGSLSPWWAALCHPLTGDGGVVRAHLATLPPPPTPTPTPSTCVGACNGTAQVTVDELLTMVNIALGTTSLSTCTAGDGNNDGSRSTRF